MDNRISHRLQVAEVIVVADQRGAYGVDKFTIPLRPKTSPTFTGTLGNPGVLLEILGDGERTGITFLELFVDPLHQRPALGQIMGGIVAIAVAIADVNGRIPTQAIEMILINPHQRVITQILAHFGSAIVRPCVAPGGSGALIVIEIDATQIILVPAIKAPEIKIAWPQMVVDHIHDDTDAVGVGTFDKILECIRTAIVAFDRKDRGRVIAPRNATSEFHRRHQFDHIDAKRLQVGQLGRCFIKGSR